MRHYLARFYGLENTQKLKLPLNKSTANPQILPTKTAEEPQFIETLRHAFPGRLAFQDISVQRIGTETTPISNANIHLMASGDWLSNGASPVLTGKTP